MKKINLLPVSQIKLNSILQLTILVLTISSLAYGVGPGSWRWNPRQTKPQDSLVKVYLFNVTNPEEVITGSPPVLAEVGPYVYRERRVRFNISTTLMKTVKFQENKTYEFLPQLSNGSENDVINFVNIPFISAVAQLQGVPFMGPGLIETLLKYNETIVRKNLRVVDLLYDGIDAHMYVEILRSLQQSTPPQMAGGKFGLFKGKNGTDDGQVEVQEGVDYLHNIGEVVSWNNLTVLTHWLESRCNRIKGTDGTVFPPGIKNDTVLNFYNPELCRSLSLVYEKEEEVNSIPGFKFIFPDSLLEDPEVNEDNTCYCKDFDEFDLDFSVCLKKGVIDLAPCRGGAPMVSSYPHFLDANPMYGQKVKGLSPKRELHESFIIVEPTTGSVLSSSIKFQLNVRMTPLSNVQALRHIPDYLFPAMWIDKSFTMDEDASLSLNSEKDEENIMSKEVEIESNELPLEPRNAPETRGAESVLNSGVFYPCTSFLIIVLSTFVMWIV